jgi:potassium/chloride transporter 8
MLENLAPNFTLLTEPPPFVNIHAFFTVLGIFFPSICGVFAGVNMSGDLTNPAKNIPLGTISAVILSFLLYVIFFITFAGTTDRQSLVDNQMIGAVISGSDWLFNIGIYFSSLSGGASATYG